MGYIFIDRFTGDELMSTAFGDEAPKHNEAVYEGEGTFVNKSGDVDVNIGANPSAEEAEEGVDSSGVTQVINVVDTCRLNKMDGLFPTKKDFGGFIKTYLGKLKKELEEKEQLGSEEDWLKKEDAIKKFVQNIVAKNFKQFEFYTGDSMSLDGQVVMCQWKDNDKGEEAPFFYVFAAGVTLTKL